MKSIMQRISYLRNHVLMLLNISVPFQTYFLMPGEAQKIERLMEVFSGRYVQCNPDVMTKFHSNDTVFIMAFAIILLNTDLHTPNIKVFYLKNMSITLQYLDFYSA